jgi:hypothetical protein
MADPAYNFYNLNIDTPMSNQLGRGWDGSQLQKLHSTTDGQIYMHELEGRALDAEYAWKLVDAYFSSEDSTITYFRAYGLNGEHLTTASFGVNWNDVGNGINTTDFKYKPKYGNSYYVPVENKFHTPNTGGYFVQVLSLDCPSEGLSFGMFKQGDKHESLVVSFRLMKIN